MYFIKTPWWLPKLFSQSLIWKMPASIVPTVYLTFDDGPHPVATPFALEALEKYQAKGTFFCIGKNVLAHPEIFKRIKTYGHSVGNHTQNHLNGWHTATATYLANIHDAGSAINSLLFRPPYGRIKRSQVKFLRKSAPPYKIIMWDILSADFDPNITPQQCLDHVLKHISPGSIVVFHDSAKAWERMSYALPLVLSFCNNKGWICAAIK